MTREDFELERAAELAEERAEAQRFDAESDTRGTRAERRYERQVYGD